MENDPFYLSEEASLGVLSVEGNFCSDSLSKNFKIDNIFFIKKLTKKVQR
jgi:hypothetical protein